MKTFKKLYEKRRFLIDSKEEFGRIKKNLEKHGKKEKIKLQVKNYKEENDLFTFEVHIKGETKTEPLMVKKTIDGFIYYTSDKRIESYLPVKEIENLLVLIKAVTEDLSKE